MLLQYLFTAAAAETNRKLSMFQNMDIHLTKGKDVMLRLSREYRPSRGKTQIRAQYYFVRKDCQRPDSVNRRKGSNGRVISSFNPLNEKFSGYLLLQFLD